MNNATPASVTYLYLSKTSQQGINVANVLLDLTAKSEIQLIQKSDVLRYLIGEVVSITDATNYVKLKLQSPILGRYLLRFRNNEAQYFMRNPNPLETLQGQ